MDCDTKWIVACDTVDCFKYLGSKVAADGVIKNLFIYF